MAVISESNEFLAVILGEKAVTTRFQPKKVNTNINANLCQKIAVISLFLPLNKYIT
jgi:hypothetical protein